MVTQQQQDWDETAMVDVMDMQQQVQCNNNVLNTINTKRKIADIPVKQSM